MFEVLVWPERDPGDTRVLVVAARSGAQAEAIVRRAGWRCVDASARASDREPGTVEHVRDAVGIDTSMPGDVRLKCPACRFDLIGLQIDAGGRVGCPECGKHTALMVFTHEAALAAGWDVPGDAGGERPRRVLGHVALGLSVLSVPFVLLPPLGALLGLAGGLLGVMRARQRDPLGVWAASIGLLVAAGCVLLMAALLL